MSQGESLEKLRLALAKFNGDRDWDKFHAPKNLATALSIEASELLEVFVWLSEQESRTLSEKALASAKEEIGDVMICLVNLAAKLGIDPVEAAFAKLEKNAMKYPVEKSRGKAKKYTDLD